MSIPHIIHYCWFGGKPLPSKLKKYMRSWETFCPDFEIKKWDESNCDLNINDYVREAYAAGKYAFVSDYFRLLVVYEHGGIYLDTDVELLCSIDRFIPDNGFFARQTDGFVTTGLGFAAEAGNEVVRKMLDAYEGIHFLTENGTLDLTPCPERNTKSIEMFFEDGLTDKNTLINGMRVFEPEYFCPIDYYTGKMHMTDNTMAIHWFANSWYSRSQSLALPVKKQLKKFLGHDKYEEVTHKIAKVMKLE